MEFSERDEVFGNFKDGLFFYFIYVITEISVKSTSKNWITRIIKFVVISISIIIAARLIAWIAFINMYFVPALAVFVIITTFFLSAVLIRSRETEANKPKWQYFGVLAISLTPILLINFSYYLTFNPYWIDSKTHNGWRYYIVPSRTWDDYEGFTNIYKCKEKGINCALLTTFWSSFPPNEIIVDASTNEVHFIETTPISRLAYTDAGVTTRYYDRFAVATLDSNLYFLSIESGCPNQNPCKISTYQVYLCKEDFIACRPLPIIYTDTWSNTDMLEFEINDREIYLYTYDEDYNKSLVFIYGDNPKCFKAGCSISKQ